MNRHMPISVRSKIWDITSLPAYNKTVSSLLGTQNDIMKQGGVALSHGVLVLPSSVVSLKVLLLHSQLDHGALLKLHFSFVQYMSRLKGKLPIRFHL